MLNWSIFMKTQRCENGKTEAGRTKTKKDTPYECKKDTPYECDRIL